MIRVAAALLLFAVVTPAIGAEAAKPPVDPNKVRCKREATTGSLVAGNKVCHTEGEWHELYVQAHNQTIQLQDSYTAGGSGH
jgi:hypothetical protein